MKHYRYIPFPVDWDVTPPTRSRKKERYIKYRSWRGGSHNIDRSDVYEIKYMDGLKLLTENDKGKSGQGKKNNSNLLGRCLQRSQCRTPLTRCRAFTCERRSGAYCAGRIAMTVNLPCCVLCVYYDTAMSLDCQPIFDNLQN